MATSKGPQKGKVPAKAPATKQSQTNTTLTGEPVDKIVIDPNTEDGSKAVAEAATVQMRIKRSITMKRYKNKIQRAKQVARKRLAGKKQLSRRSLKKAKDLLRKRFAGQRGAKYSTLSRQDKVAVDKLLDKRKALIKKVAGKIYSRVKQNELRRFGGAVSGKPSKRAAIPIVASLDLSFKDCMSLVEKAHSHNFDTDVIFEVYRRGAQSWNEQMVNTKQQHAFARVNSYIARGKAYELDSDLNNEE